jgi:hypothetical protein
MGLERVRNGHFQTITFINNYLIHNNSGASACAGWGIPDLVLCA